MNFIKLILTEFSEVYPISNLYWQSNKIYRVTQKDVYP